MLTSLGLYISMLVSELKHQGDLKNKPIVHVLVQTEKIKRIVLNFKIYTNE